MIAMGFIAIACVIAFLGLVGYNLEQRIAEGSFSCLPSRSELLTLPRSHVQLGVSVYSCFHI